MERPSTAPRWKMQTSTLEPGSLSRRPLRVRGAAEEERIEAEAHERQRARPSRTRAAKSIVAASSHGAAHSLWKSGLPSASATAMFRALVRFGRSSICWRIVCSVRSLP